MRESSSHVAPNRVCARGCLMLLAVIAEFTPYLFFSFWCCWNVVWKIRCLFDSFFVCYFLSLFLCILFGPLFVFLVAIIWPNFVLCFQILSKLRPNFVQTSSQLRHTSSHFVTFRHTSSLGRGIPLNIHGYPWISMDIHGCPWISMDEVWRSLVNKLRIKRRSRSPWKSI